MPVRQLLSKPELLLDEWMPLDGALSDSGILLRAELKVKKGHSHHWYELPAGATFCKCLQILNSMMIEAPQPAMTDSKKGEVALSPDQGFRTLNKDKSEPPSHE